MHFGDIEVLPIHGGNFYLDGGAMFGVVPKTLWEKKAPADGIESEIVITQFRQVRYGHSQRFEPGCGGAVESPHRGHPIIVWHKDLVAYGIVVTELCLL